MSITTHFDARLFEAQELIDKQTARHIVEMERITELEAALSEIREVWIGSDGFMPQTCPEGYLQRLVIQGYDIAVEALKK